ncbi:polysaccharide deacetylase family protein [Paraburkholderia sp. BL6669N2]|uniref:polysaccharide deacetylase family protein n=1 Tax=Paraburkholderia sp. BL6669N2 TaxID=1938807 RepID=UPI002161A660|nr:polysaccharide deacetylase family protein [Paraburkholderia sp. BL6669N2]
MKVLDCISEARGECHDRAGRRDVLLTFDDGPIPPCTPDVLDVPAEHRVPPTFYVIGAYVEDQPELIQRMIAEGHEIANRTMTHPDGVSPGTVRHLHAPYGTWTDEAIAEAEGGVGLCPAWCNCVLARRMSSRRVRTVRSCWAARPDPHGAFPPDSSTA